MDQRWFSRRSLVARAGSLLFLASLTLAQEAGRGPAADESAPRPPRIVLATVDGHELTLDAAIDTFLSSHTGHGMLIRGEPAVRDLTGRLVERELFLEEARTLGVPEEPRVVDLIERYRRRLAADEFWKREVRDRAHVDDEEVESFYAKTDVALRLTLIVCAERAEAEALRERVAAGEDMGVLARTRSIDSSRTFDGSLQYVRRGEVERAVEEAAFALEEPGALSDVFASEKGFGFVRLEERSINPERPAREIALPQIRGILEERLTKKLAAEAEERALAEAGGWVDEEKLALPSILDGADPAVQVARAGADGLTLQDVRDGLDLDALRAAPVEAAAGAGLALARQWVRAECLAEAGLRAGLLEEPELATKLESFRREVVMKFLCETYVWPSDPPSEEELRRSYEEHQATEYTTAPEVRLAYIVVAREEAPGVLERLRAGADFEALARELSRDAVSSKHGGRIGWIKPGEVLPEVEAVAFGLEPGVLGGPVDTEAGSFLLKVLERKEPRLLPYASARATVLSRMVKTRQSEAYAKWALALRERADVRLDENGVRAAVEWLEDQALQREAEKAARAPAEAGAPVPPGHAAPGSPHAPRAGEREQP